MAPKWRVRGRKKLGVEKIDDAIQGAAYPRFVRAIGACPPEDVGGFVGYDDFLEAMADPKHEEHYRALEWYSGKFDPDEAEIGRLLDNFERLAIKMGTKAAQTKSSSKTHLISKARQRPSPDTYAPV